jgi:chaperonin GroES
VTFKLDKALYSTNIADDLDEDTLKEMGWKISQLVEDDDLSRQGWLSDQDEWIKLAAQVRETKDFPWERASNVKYPLVSLASLQFHARALPSLVNSTLPVQAKVLGEDPQLQKQSRADRVRRYMSYQILDEMEEWMDEMDRMMIVLPIIGLCYKKTYYSDNLGRCRSVLVLPRDLILNYYATDYIRARMSHVIIMDRNELKEFQNKGIFLDVELESGQSKVITGMRDETIGLSPGAIQDEDTPYELIESHCWWDLDEDGYKEPYIVTFHRDSKKVLRITARWEENGIEYSPKGKIVKITPCSYFTPFQFFPDPNSSVYGIGFGRLLGPTNETVNTLINQLVDAGTLSNLQSGFLTRGVKLKGGSTRFKPGEWKIVNTTGDDLRKGVVPMPVREPSSTLYQLLGMLIDSGQRLSSVSDMMVGENPGQNQPASTTMAVLEQGLKVFTGIYKRIHRSLASEYRKLYNLNFRYLDEKKYQTVLDEGVVPPNIPQGATPEQAQQIQMQAQQNPQQIATLQDFSPEGLDIVPESDPNFVSDGQKSMKAQNLLQDLQMGLPLNIQVVTEQVLRSQGQDNIQALMQQQPQGPSQAELEYKLEVEREKVNAFKAWSLSVLQLAQAEALEHGSNLDHLRAVVDDYAKVFGVETDMKLAQHQMSQPVNGSNSQ